jgi:hypothetical protein
MSTARTLLVEGNDDFHVILNLQGTRPHRVIDKKEIKVLGGFTEVLESFPVALRTSESGVVGVILDADSNLGGRWDSIKSTLHRLGYKDVPSDPLADGAIIEPPDDTILPKVGVWLMPDNSNVGILENFLRFLVPSNDPLIGHAEKAVKELPLRRFSENDEPKALIHTWLAWQAEPGRPFGQAITARFLDPNVPEAQKLLDWLYELFSE